MLSGTSSHLLFLTATEIMHLTPWKLSKNFIYNFIFTSTLRVSSKLVDYKTQIWEHSFYLTDEFRRSGHELWGMERISVIGRVILYIKQLLYHSNIEMQIILKGSNPIQIYLHFWEFKQKNKQVLHIEMMQLCESHCKRTARIMMHGRLILSTHNCACLNESLVHQVRPICAQCSDHCASGWRDKRRNRGEETFRHHGIKLMDTVFQRYY